VPGEKPSETFACTNSRNYLSCVLIFVKMVRFRRFIRVSSETSHRNMLQVTSYQEILETITKTHVKFDTAI
jgi:hypothetical protein